MVNLTSGRTTTAALNRVPLGDREPATLPALTAPAVQRVLVTARPVDPAVARRATQIAALAFTAVAVIQVWIISAGGVLPLPSYSSYYNRQADAFLKGQASLLMRPAPGHLGLADPYDPAANRLYRRHDGVHDAVLYGGRFYLYWGPIPALILAPLKHFGGLQIIGDEYLVLGFSVGTALLTTVILRRVWGRFFGDQPLWTLAAGVLVAGVAMPMGFTLARPAVYEAAILGGQFFLLAGIALLCLPPLLPNRVAAGDPLPRPGALAAASTCLTCAVGSRISLAIAVAVLAVGVTLRIVRCGWRRNGRVDLRRLLAFTFPLAAGAAALASYNHARFGQWLEFGQKYQLTSANYRATPALFSVANLCPSLYSYALRPMYIVGQFPYLIARGGEGTFPSFIRIPPHYEFNEPIVGLLRVTPFIWLALLAPSQLLVRAIRRRAGRWSGNCENRPPVALDSNRGDSGLTRLVIYCMVASVVGFAPVLFMLGSTLRYLADLTPCLMIVAMIGVWERGQKLQHAGRSRRKFLAIVGVFAVYSVVVGLLFSITGYYDHFRTFNAAEWGRTSYGTTESPPPMHE